MTNDLVRRIAEHKTGQDESFTKRYNLTKLIYAEVFQDVNDAIAAEKKIKSGSRKKKVELAKSNNPDWNDLAEELT